MTTAPALRTPTGLRRAPLFGGALAGAALLVASCSGGPSAPSAAGVAHLATTSTTHRSSSLGGSSSLGTGDGNALAYAQCMRSHGVPAFPDPDSRGNFEINASPNGVNPGSAQFQAAQQTCGKLLPNGGQPTPAEQAQGLAHALKYSQCMRSHGVPAFPDPTAAGGGGISIRISRASGIDPNSAPFKAAQQVCQKIMGAPFGGGSQSSSGGNGKAG